MYNRLIEAEEEKLRIMKVINETGIELEYKILEDFKEKIEIIKERIKIYEEKKELNEIYEIYKKIITEQSKLLEKLKLIKEKTKAGGNTKKNNEYINIDEIKENIEGNMKKIENILLNSKNKEFNYAGIIMNLFYGIPVLDEEDVIKDDIISYYNKFKDNREKVEDYFLNVLEKYYDEKKLNSIIEESNKNAVLIKRKNILEEAFFAHINKKYYLSVAILLTQIEGVVVDFSGYKGKSDSFIIKSEIEKKIEELNIEESIYYAKDIYACILDFSIKNILEDEYYSKFEHCKERKSKISRNAILHGEDKEYGNRKNSLLMISLLEALMLIWGK